MARSARLRTSLPIIISAVLLSACGSGAADTQGPPRGRSTGRGTAAPRQSGVPRPTSPHSLPANSSRASSACLLSPREASAITGFDLSYASASGAYVVAPQASSHQTERRVEHCVYANRRLSVPRATVDVVLRALPPNTALALISEVSPPIPPPPGGPVTDLCTRGDRELTTLVVGPTAQRPPPAIARTFQQAACDRL